MPEATPPLHDVFASAIGLAPPLRLRTIRYREVVYLRWRCWLFYAFVQVQHARNQGIWIRLYLL